VIVYQNSLITLTYAPETDILSVDWPNFEPYATLEIRESLLKLVEIVRNYDVKKLLIDASKANIGMNDDAYRAILLEFAGELEKTHIQKLARIKTQDPSREVKVTTLRSAMPFPYDFQNFSTEQEALAWLAAD